MYLQINQSSQLNVLQAKFHTSFIGIIKGVPLAYYDSIIRALLILIPNEMPDGPKSPYGWEYLMRKIPSALLRAQEVGDIVKATVVLLVLDVISIVIGGCTNDFLRPETFDLIFRQIFHYLHIVSQKKMNTEYEGPLFDKAFTRCAVIIGYIFQSNAA